MYNSRKKVYEREKCWEGGDERQIPFCEKILRQQVEECIFKGGGGFPVWAPWEPTWFPEYNRVALTTFARQSQIGSKCRLTNGRESRNVTE